MASKNKQSEQAAEIRRQAEEKARQNELQPPENVAALSGDDVRRLLHELRVHQIQLEMQNEELHSIQEELDAARGRYFDLYDLAPVGYCTLSTKGVVLEANLTAANLLGVSRSALVTKPLSRFILKEDLGLFCLLNKRLVETGKPQACELRITKKDRTIFWVRLEATVAMDVAGGPVIRLVMSDVTEHRQEAKALRESEQRYRAMMEQAADAVIVHDEQGRILDVNKKACKIYGYTRDELLSMVIADVSPSATPAEKREIWSRVFAGEQITFEGRHFRKDRSTFPVEVSLSMVRLHSGPAVLGIVRDISGRNQAMNVLRQYELLAANSRDIMLFVRRDDGRILEANEAATLAYGYSRDELLALTIQQLRAPESVLLTPSQMAQADEKGILFETVHRRRDGSTFPVEVSSKGATINTTRTLVSVIRDITARRQTEDALRKSEELNGSILNALPAHIAVTNRQGRIISVNRAWMDFALENGPAESSAISVGVNYLDVCRRASEGGDLVAIQILSGIEAVLNGTQSQFTMDYPCHSPQQERWYSMTVVPLNTAAGGGAVIAHRDITEAKQAEKALSESEERHRLLAETMLQGVVHQDIDGKIISMNPAAERILGKTRDTFLGSCSVQEEHDTIREDGQPYPGMEHPAMVSLRTCQPVHEVVMGVFNPKLGEYRWISIDAVPVIRPNEKQPVEVYTVFADITDRKRVQEQLKKSEERYRLIAENAIDVIWVLDVESNVFTYISPSIERLRGYTAEDVMKQTFADMLAPRSLQFVQSVLPGRVELFRQGHVEFYVDEIEQFHKDGHIVSTEITTRFIKNTSTGHIEAIGASRDVTERRRAAESLRESEARFAQLAEQGNTFVWEVDAKGLYTYASHVVHAVLGYHPDELVGKKHFYDLHPVYGREVFKKTVLESFERKDVLNNLENPIQTRDRRQIWVSTNGMPVLNSDGTLRGYRGSDTDITERKQAGESLRENQRFLSDMIENSGSAIFTKDIEGRYELVNRKWEEITDTKREFAIGKTSEELFRSVGKEFRKGDLRAMELGSFIEAEETFENEEGVRTLLTVKFPLRDSKNAIRGICGMSTDITARKQAELALNKALYNLNERNKELKCLYAASSLVMELAGPLDDTLKTIVNLMPPGWQYPEITCARIIFKGRKFTTANFKETAWKQSADIMVSGQAVGTMEVCYLEERPMSDEGPFLKEERSLIVDLARLLGAKIDRRQAEDALREERQRLGSIIMGANVGTWEWNVQTGETIFNDRWAEIIGYSLEEISPFSIETWMKYAHPDDLKASGEMLEKHFRGEIDYYDVEARMKHKNGTWVWVLDRGKVTSWTSDGKPLLMQGTHTDITKRKQSEQMLSVRSRLTELSWQASLDEMLQAAVDMAEQLTGSCIGFFHFVSEDQQTLTLQAWSTNTRNNMCKAQTKGLHYPVAQAGIWADCMRRRVPVIHNDYASQPDKKGYPQGHAHVQRELTVPVLYGQAVVAIIGVGNKPTDYVQDDVNVIQELLRHLVDLVARKRVEDEVRETKKRLEAITNSTQDAIIMMDPRGVISYWNPAAETIFGYRNDEAIGRNLHAILAPEAYLEKYLAEFSQFVRTGQGNAVGKMIELVAHRKGGQNIVIELSLSAILLNSEWHSVGVVRDVTRRKQIEVERDKLEIQFMQAQKMESVGRLAGGVAHDFNNMLGVILGNVELAMKKVDPAEKLHTRLTEIRKAAQHSADLTRQLLAFARKQPIAPKVLDLNETVSSMLKILKRLIGENIDLKLLPDASLWLVKMDPSQIDQILANLCVNARDAIANDGRVIIEMGNSSFDEAFCRDHPGYKPGEYVRMTVSDTGCGMSKETLAQIFEPFFTTKELGKGTGLGLATIYGTVQQNHGIIDVFSEPGKGTAFHIYLPRYVEKPGQKLADEDAKPTLRGQESILVVEDEPGILDITTAMLQGQGYTVLSASAPAEAIRLVRENVGKIQLLVTDVVMPGMNGYELAQNLKSICPSLKYLFMSGYTADVIARHGVLDDGIHFIQKPFTIRDLAAKVREVLDQKS